MKLILNRLCALFSTVPLLSNACDEQYLKMCLIRTARHPSFCLETGLFNSPPPPLLIDLSVCTLEM